MIQTNPIDDATRERRARTWARSMGLKVSKSHRDGTYMVLDASTNGVVALGLSSGYGLCLASVEDELADQSLVQE